MNTPAQVRALTFVMSFAAGVLVMDIAREHREWRAAEVAARAIAVAETYAMACGQPAPVTIMEPRR